MEYKGQLYGKKRNTYFKMAETAAQVDKRFKKLEKENKKLKKEINLNSGFVSGYCHSVDGLGDTIITSQNNEKFTKETAPKLKGYKLEKVENGICTYTVIH